MYWISISMTILANIVYHMCAKNSGPAHPLTSLAVAYSVSLLSCLLLYPLFTQRLNVFSEVGAVNWTGPTLGIAIVLLECGFILAYRFGWKLSNAALFSNVLVSILLIPIAIFFFSTSPTPKNIAGAVLAVGGLFLMAR
jgi:hypothetical protein